MLSAQNKCSRISIMQAVAMQTHLLAPAHDWHDAAVAAQTQYPVWADVMLQGA
jgi:hypothetical protein